MALSFPTAPFATGRPTLSAARARLADVLNHPAFEPGRRHKAQELMHTSGDAQQRRRAAG